MFSSSSQNGKPNVLDLGGLGSDETGVHKPDGWGTGMEINVEEGVIFR